LDGVTRDIREISWRSLIFRDCRSVFVLGSRLIENYKKSRLIAKLQEKVVASQYQTTPQQGRIQSVTSLK